MKRILLTFAIAMLGGAINSQAQTTIWSENFESVTTPSLPTGWTQTSINTPGWKTNSGTVDWGALFGYPTGYYYVPSHTKYAIVDAWADSSVSKTLYNDMLVSPTIDLSSTSHPFVSFQMFMLGVYLGGTPTFATKENFEVYISDDNGTTWSPVDSVNAMDPWGTHYTSLAGHNSSTTKVGFRYFAAFHGAGAALDSVVVFDNRATDLALMSAQGGHIATGNNSTNSYALASSPTTLGGTVYNYGSSTITSFDINYTLDGGSVMTSNSGTVSIAPFTSYSFSGVPLTTGSTVGTQNIKMWVSVTGDVKPDNDSTAVPLHVISNMPNKRLLIEEGTGAWCGWCVRGIVFMDSIWEANNNNVSIIAVHDSSYGRPDGMANDNVATVGYDNFITPKVQGYPNCYFDRHYVADPSYAFDYYNVMKDYFGFADIALDNITYTSSTLNATVNVTPAINMSGDYRLALVVTEDSVHNTNDPNGGFDQHNYYSGYMHLSGAGMDFFTLPSVISSSVMYYKFVARTSVPNFSSSPNGVSGSLPSSMTAGTQYSYTFSGVTLDPKWVGRHLRVTAMLIDNNPSSNTYGQVLNTNNTGYWPLAVTNVPTAGISTLTVYPNPAINIATASFNLAEASNISVHVYNELGQDVYSIPTQQMNKGTNHITIPVSSLASGAYIVMISSDKGSMNQRLTISK